MKSRISLMAIWVVVIAGMMVDMSLQKWKLQEEVIKQDVHYYYGYLPASFIYEDLAIAKSDYKYSESGFYFWLAGTNDGKAIFKKTYGLALLYSPFFFSAHLAANIFDFPVNGFSEPYLFFLLLSSLFFLCIGLMYIRQCLKMLEFSEMTIAITILLIGLGTNLFCYATQSAPMPHVYSFCLVSMLFYFMLKWKEKGANIYLPAMGVVLGLISLIEFRNTIVIIFLAGCLVPGLKRPASVLSGLKKSLLLFLPAFVLWIPQFLYWNYVTGKFHIPEFPGENYFFNDPKIWMGLFSFRKGWFIYTPVMLFAVTGIFFLRGHLKRFRTPLVLFLLVNLYLVFSWWAWWYGGSFGQRPLIDIYAILSLPLAALVSKILSSGKIVRVAATGISIFLIWLNIFQTFQFENTALHWEGMTAKLYFKQFGKMERIDDYDSYVSWINEQDARNGNR